MIMARKRHTIHTVNSSQMVTLFADSRHCSWLGFLGSAVVIFVNKLQWHCVYDDLCWPW